MGELSFSGHLQQFPHLVCYPLVVLEASATHWSIVLVPQSHWLVKAHYRHALQLLGHMMLDRDLAKAYGVETKALNQAVKRNIQRFEGEDYSS